MKKILLISLLILKSVIMQVVEIIHVSTIEDNEVIFTNEKEKTEFLNQILLINYNKGKKEVSLENVNSSRKQKKRSKLFSCNLFPSDVPFIHNNQSFNTTSEVQLEKYIPTSYKLHRYIALNLVKFIGKKYIPITGISIYPVNNSYFDFFNEIEFTVSETGLYTDKITKSLLQGVLYKNREELVKNSIVSKTGFFVTNSKTDEEDNNDVLAVKKVIGDQFKDKEELKKAFDELSVPLIDEIIISKHYPLKDHDLLDICICKNSSCNTECSEIRKVYRKDLQ